MNFTIDRQYLLETVADLIRIDSTNPSLVPAGRGEAEIAAYVGDSLGGIGLGVETYEAQPGRPSVVGTLKGSGGGRSLMLNAHMDTVGVEGMPDPFSAAVHDGKMYGRGSYDMKGSLAACMAVAKALAEAAVTLKGDLLVAAVADEEYASIGTTDLVKRLKNKVHAAVVTEPTELEICLAHKGFAWLEVETAGRAAHGSRFSEGVDANMRMGRFLAELDKLERDLRARRAHPWVGPPSLHAATLNGGTGLSTYAASCKLQIERRTIPGETETDVLFEIEDIVRRLSASDATFQATVKTLFVRGPFEVSQDASIVQALSGAVTKVLGKRAAYAGRPFWMDAALLSAAGIETVAIGPAGAGAHSADEWVDIQSLLDLSQILAEAAVGFTGWRAA